MTFDGTRGIEGNGGVIGGKGICCRKRQLDGQRKGLLTEPMCFSVPRSSAGKKIHQFDGSATRSRYHVFSVPRSSSLNKSVPRHIPFDFGLSQGPGNGYLPVSFGDPSRMNREIMV